MSELSGVFDHLADALKAADAAPSRTLRIQHPPPPRPAPRTVPLVDCSRDYADYAAPHRPSRPHVPSRPDDVITKPIMRRVHALVNARETGESLRMVMISFTVTVVLGLSAVFLFTSQ
jgi:hypothetical protein